jgi:hypothetical protein
VAHGRRQSQGLSHTPGGSIATAYFRPHVPPELEFATHRQQAESQHELKEANEFHLGNSFNTAITSRVWAIAITTIQRTMSNFISARSSLVAAARFSRSGLVASGEIGHSRKFGVGYWVV